MCSFSFHAIIFSSGAELVEADGLSSLVVLLVRQMRLISFQLPYSVLQYQWSHSKSDALCFDLFNADVLFPQ